MSRQLLSRALRLLGEDHERSRTKRRALEVRDQNAGELQPPEPFRLLDQFEQTAIVTATRRHDDRPLMEPTARAPCRRHAIERHPITVTPLVQDGDPSPEAQPLDDAPLQCGLAPQGRELLVHDVAGEGPECRRPLSPCGVGPNRVHHQQDPDPHAPPPGPPGRRLRHKTPQGREEGLQKLTYSSSRNARSIQAIFSCRCISSVRKSFVPMSRYFSAHVSRSARRWRMIAS
ncbi:hypothetical protein HRbin10_02663 [bacterium HR10]|nr:hypothetical protein HRbin10_02663 [bacterium HR10]